VLNDLKMEAVTSLAGTEAALQVFADAWGSDALSGSDTYFAAATHGSYLGVGWINDEPVTAAFGFLSVDPVTGGPALHSHMAATKRSHVNQGLAYGMKTHQRLWAIDHGLVAITWTYDPLQRRNAWFNLARLGASVIGFKRNYYGALKDTINASVETDRCEVRWDVRTESGEVVVPGDHDLVVSIPESIDDLRADKLTEAIAEQSRMRDALDQVADGSMVVRGISPDRCYVLSPSGPGGVVGKTS
jgi:predicted GNAT superfamily acetyltransferase